VGFFEHYDGFVSSECNGTVFAALGKLIELGAKQELCLQKLRQSEALSRFRLKSILFRKFVLKENAKLAYVELCSEDFSKSGASWDDVEDISKELLNIVNVKKVIVKESDDKERKIMLEKEV
jgi:hypothetical protein